MFGVRFWLLPIAMLALASCASLNEDQCRAGDWREIGFADGAEGRGADRIEAHRKACADFGVVPDTAAWRAGRDQGLRLYCLPAKAYDVGSRGLSIAPGCTAEELAAMRPAHCTRPVKLRRVRWSSAHVGSHGVRKASLAWRSAAHCR